MTSCWVLFWLCSKVNRILFIQSRTDLVVLLAVDWENQANDKADLQSSCVMHAHMALLYRGGLLCLF